MKKIIWCGLVLTLISISAHAAERSIPIRTSAPVYELPTWNDFYWGVAMGAGWEKAQHTGTALNSNYNFFQGPGVAFSGVTVSSTSLIGNHKVDGLTGDFFIGKNAQFGNFVGSLQLEGTLAKFSSSRDGYGVTISPLFTTFPNAASSISTFSYQATIQPHYMVSAILREGWLFSPQALIYALTGATYANFEYTNLNSFTDKFYAPGFVGGVGAEQKFSSRWSLRGEYRYIAFRHMTVTNIFTFTNDTVQPPTPFVTSVASKTTQLVRFTQTMHTVQVGAAYPLQ